MSENLTGRKMIVFIPDYYLFCAYFNIWCKYLEKNDSPDLYLALKNGRNNSSLTLCCALFSMGLCWFLSTSCYLSASGML